MHGISGAVRGVKKTHTHTHPEVQVPIFTVSGPENHQTYGSWSLKSQILGDDVHTFMYM